MVAVADESPVQVDRDGIQAGIHYDARQNDWLASTKPAGLNSARRRDLDLQRSLGKITIIPKCEFEGEFVTKV